MRTLNVHETKTSLSRLLVDVEAGETVTIARAGKPVAWLAPIGAEAAPKRRIGMLDGRMDPLIEAFDSWTDAGQAAFEGLSYGDPLPGT